MKTLFRAQVTGSKDSISAEEWNAVLEGALQLMIYKGTDEVEILELVDGEYEHSAYLQLVGA